MSTPPQAARILLLPAKEAPYVAMLRRKPTRLVHVMRLNTATDEIEHGSWFRGKLYPMRCDISHDGQWMVYSAMGATGQVWSGVCQLPYLRTVLESNQSSTYGGGGYWRDRNVLILNQWEKMSGEVPFALEAGPFEPVDDDLKITYARLKRDGWTPSPERYVDKDSGWRSRPGQRFPFLRLWSMGYVAQKGGYVFQFALDDYDGLLDPYVSWACWDSVNNLVFSRLGVVYRYSLQDLERGQPGATFDLESLEPPVTNLSTQSETN